MTGLLNSKKFKLIAILSLVLCVSLLCCRNVFAVDEDTAQTNHQVIKGTTTTAGETIIQQIIVDFAKKDTMAFYFLQDGFGGMTFNVYDSANKLIATQKYNTIKEGGKAVGHTIHNIEKPSNGMSVEIYTVKILPESDIQTNYRVAVGSVTDLEELISGEENAFRIPEFVNRTTDGKHGNNYYEGTYLPNKNETWIKYEATDNTTTITLVSDHPQLRFKVIKPSKPDYIYDSNTDLKAHRTKYIGDYSDCEKVKLDTKKSEEIIVILYIPPELQVLTESFEGNYRLMVGQPQIFYSERSKPTYSATTIAGNEQSFSEVASINFTDVPKTAQVEHVFLQCKGVDLIITDIEQWAVKTGSSKDWQYSTKNTATYSATINPVIVIPYGILSPGNSFLNETWYFSFMSSSVGGDMRMTPGMFAFYYYETGD